ncbi:MAG TPA: hypothetical protein OIM61_04720 [Clostridiaceae bacterium]|nr:hypothetical protein [Clostridiaceae bacterium]
MNMENLLEKEEIDRILKIESKIEKRGKEIQKKYNFEIPDYVLHEIVEKEGENSSNNIIALINLAKVNNRLLPEDADILRKEVKSKKVYEKVCITN